MRRFRSLQLRIALDLVVGVAVLHACLPRGETQSPPPVQGGLTANQIRTVIQRNIAQVQHCYEELLGRRSTATGRVTVAFIIGPDGHVSGSSVAEDSLDDATNARCIAEAVRTWVFPRPEPAGPVSVRFPFNLTQSGG